MKPAPPVTTQSMPPEVTGDLAARPIGNFFAGKPGSRESPRNYPGKMSLLYVQETISVAGETPVVLEP